MNSTSDPAPLRWALTLVALGFLGLFVASEIIDRSRGGSNVGETGHCNGV